MNSNGNIAERNDKVKLEGKHREKDVLKANQKVFGSIAGTQWV